jgi:hypothetical protein
VVRQSVLSASVLLLMSACAHAPASTPVDKAGDTASMEGPILGQWVEMKWDGATAEATVSGRPARLRFQQEADALHVQGTVGGLGVRLILDEQTLTGNVDGCKVRLERQRDVFMGRSDCNRPLDKDWGVYLPEGFGRLPGGPRAMLVTLSVLSGTWRNRLPSMDSGVRSGMADPPQWCGMRAAVSRFLEGRQGGGGLPDGRALERSVGACN